MSGRLVRISRPVGRVYKSSCGYDSTKPGSPVSTLSCTRQAGCTSWRDANGLPKLSPNSCRYVTSDLCVHSSPCNHRARHFSTSLNTRSKTQHDEASNREESSHLNNVNTKKFLPHGILVTGGTSGIGYQVAKRAILEGASHVRIITRDDQRGQTAVNKLRKETTASSDTQLDYVQAEVEEYTDPKLFNQTNPNSRITTIIHCAGISQTSLLTSTPPETIQKILKVNLESGALLSRALLKRYTQSAISHSRRPPPSSSSTITTSDRTSWQFISISSLLATKRGYGSTIYAASKAGLIALTRAVALEGAEVALRYRDAGVPGFRANVVVPGYIETPMVGGFSSSAKEKLIKDIPVGRFGTPEEVADAVMFLLKNEYANNCVLNIDGGLSAV